MCAQCMATAATVAGSAAGMRAWLATSPRAWITPRRLRFASAVLVVMVFVAASIRI
jgi:hypothetical protein